MGILPGTSQDGGAKKKKIIKLFYVAASMPPPTSHPLTRVCHSLLIS